MKANKQKKAPQGVKYTLKRHAKLTFIPHQSNQYRPHLIRRYGLFLVLLFVVVAQCVTGLSASGAVLGVNQAISSEELLSDTNNERTTNGLSPLEINDKLSQAAFMKAKDMFQHQYWAHVSPDGVTPWHWYGVTGYNYAYAGENLAKNFATADAAVAAWMASSEHRANVLNSHYTDIGFAVVDDVLNGKPTTIIVALYGQPVGAAAVASVAPKVITPEDHGITLAGRLAVALHSVTPVMIAALVVVLMTAFVAFMTHFYRKRLPKSLQRSWYKHHGAYKAAGLVSLVIVVLSLYSGGQI